MNLLQAYVHRCHELDLFSQKRTQVRASRLLLCNLLCLGRKWITRIICMANRDQCDWSADYKLFSRSPWRSQDLFTPVVRNSLDYFDPAEPIIIVRQINALRRQYDMIGAAARLLLFVMDGGFCNRTVFRAPRKGARILVRCRKDAKLWLPANHPTQPRRIYAKEKFTPEDVRTNDSAWQKDHFFIGDKWRPVRFKQISSVLWQGGAGKLPLRLIVIASF
jgi:hypothetical protein